jgi:transcriptional regulator with GAF, ATPase, and Fis domain
LVGRFAARIGKRIDGVDRETMDRLSAYAWPGNVRELENMIERAVILANGPILEIEPELFNVPEQRPKARETASLAELEREHMLAVLNQTGWVIEGAKGAALILGLHPNTLRSRLKKLGLSRGAHEIS